MAQTLLRRFLGPNKVVTSTDITSWAPIFEGSELSPENDGTFIYNDLGVTMEITSDSTNDTAMFQVASGATKTVPIPGKLFWRVQDPNRARRVVARQVQM